MNKITLILVISLLNLINSIEHKKYALILPYSERRHNKTNSYCIHFKVVKNLNSNCLLKERKEVYVWCESPAINKFGDCNGEGFYGLNSYFLNIKNNCFGIWLKFNKTLNCAPDFIFI